MQARNFDFPQDLATNKAKLTIAAFLVAGIGSDVNSCRVRSEYGNIVNDVLFVQVISTTTGAAGSH